MNQVLLKKVRRKKSRLVKNPNGLFWESTGLWKRRTFRKLQFNSSDFNKLLRSAPVWAENPTTFDAHIKSRVGKGIKQIDGLDQQFFESLSEKISVWFPVQLAVLPKLLEDNPTHDIAISAPTGSGKTLCYLIPILNRILSGWKSKYIMAVVLAPTKTLIRQISNVSSC